MLPCLNKKFFGLDCFGCGFQRAIVHLLRGEFTEAFWMYPAVYPMLILLIYTLLNLKFQFNKSQLIIRYLLLLTLFFIVGNFILKYIYVYGN
ncbi:DUF2752 domain-containing protein [Tenacibaculum sp. SG-28]|uniref:DUF2752 domain-containing protein n=1 Tax=Tenacibaculum sp. SG-28 TaxID=754426 RepID=UPI000D4B1714|nr:DUF2752 domain-containing protein [Tenacibaculum sp. SG-28]PQJ23550.1 hypothetical protein BSU00_02410 [Tenacibaculum sp. SG-28]